MNELIKALMQRLAPGEGPPMQVPPPPSVMAPGARNSDPRDIQGIQQGFDRGMLGNFLTFPDLMTAGANRVPGLPGLVMRGAFGKQKLPSDAAAEGMGLAGSGPGYDLGRAGADVVGMGMGVLGLKHKPVAGQANMFIAPGAPGYDKKLWLEFGKAASKLKSEGKATPRMLAHKAAQLGGAYDPGSRVLLQPVYTKDWEVLPDLAKRFAQQPDLELPFKSIFTNAPEMERLPEAVQNSLVGFDPKLPWETKGTYDPVKNKNNLGQGAWDYGVKKVLTHEGTHGAQRAGRLYGSDGSSPKSMLRATEDLNKILGKHSFQAYMAKASRPVWAQSPRLNAVAENISYPPQDRYQSNIGEYFAQQAEQMSMGRRPSLNIFDEIPYNKLNYGETPLPLADHLAEIQARHPQLYKKLVKRYPEVANLSKNTILFQEMLGSRGWLWNPKATGPEREAVLARKRSAPPMPIEEPPAFPPFRPQD